jgi:hypothetical protein
MFRIGNIQSKKFLIRVSPLPSLADRKGGYDYSLQFFLCLVHRLPGPMMVDLNKDEDFPFVSFRFPPKTSGDPIYQEEYRYFSHVKEHYNPMLYLHRSSIEKVIDRCFELSK